MGLRLVEALGLEVPDIDAEQMKVHVRLGKSGKDRYVILPQVTLTHLRRYWTTHRHPRLVFPAGNTSEQRHRAVKPMSKSGVLVPVEIRGYVPLIVILQFCDSFPLIFLVIDRVHVRAE